MLCMWAVCMRELEHACAIARVCARVLLYAGAIGKQFPAKLKSCMRRLRKMEPKTIQLEYGYPNLPMAVAVHNRSRGAYVVVRV